uniref:Phospholipase DDHD2-like n=1 Tax=Paramormyrops kingsleyae TaxID=1676925 RepID=A0A3B3S0G8_9TELE|nr:phospholipase DDHD2-like [Paramormyrops kingsleyae]
MSQGRPAGAGLPLSLPGAAMRDPALLSAQADGAVYEAAWSLSDAFELVDMDDVLPPYEPVQPHWFYYQQEEDKDIWLPFSKVDSRNLEQALKCGDKQEEGVLVATDGGRCDVDLGGRRRHTVFWDETPSEVRRCTWFYRGSKDGRYLPYPEEVSESLEEAYMIAYTLGEWKRTLKLSTEEVVVFHSPQLITQHRPVAGHAGDWPPPLPEHTAKSSAIKRGVDSIAVDIPEGESVMVDHLVFMVHGIGPACDLRFRSLVQCVNDFRGTSLRLLGSHFRQSLSRGAVGRVEFLPVNWHGALHGDATGVDEDIQRITLPSISRLRNFTNETLLDIFFYNSPTYCQTIVDTVATELNRLYHLFQQRHPDFAGHVSVLGHSLGSLILFDILTNQQPNPWSSSGSQTESNNDSDLPDTKSLEELLKNSGLEEYASLFQRHQMDLESLALCSESDLQALGVPLGPCKKILNAIKKKTIAEMLRAGAQLQDRGVTEAVASRSGTAGASVHATIPQVLSTTNPVNYKYLNVGIGQVLVCYPRLNFEPENFFALGSPIGMFLTVRGLKHIDPSYKFPTCGSFYNIYHPFDPVAYRIEPMILGRDVEVEPMLIPHHKGRKRMHIELRENLTRMSSDLLGSLRTVWQVLSGGPVPALPPVEEIRTAMHHTLENTNAPTPSPSCAAGHSGNGPSAAVSAGSWERGCDINVGMLNGGRRIDYVLQEKPIESFNEYLFALQSHLCYWESEDTTLLVLKEIYAKMGVYFGQT